MQSLRIATYLVSLTFVPVALAQVAPERAEWRHGYDAKVSATTECRAGCNGHRDGCQESWETAVIAASPGTRLYRESLTLSKSWGGTDTTPLANEPQWEIASVPADDPRPVSITVKPVVATCVGSNADRQSRTHYEWTAVQGRP